MTTLVRDPGTYRTTGGELVRFRPTRDGTIVLVREDVRVTGKRGLSDDPDWPDVVSRTTDPELFADATPLGLRGLREVALLVIDVETEALGRGAPARWLTRLCSIRFRSGLLSRRDPSSPLAPSSSR